MKMRALTIGLVVCLVGWGHLATAQVTSIDALTPDQEAELVEHLRSGNAAFDAGDYEGALKHYDAAVGVAWLADIFYRRGLCLERLDRTRDAILSYRRFLELDPDAREKGRVLADIERLEAKLKASERGRLKVTTSPVGAAITVRSDQGKPTSLGMSPVEIALPSGDYTLTIEHKGYETRERRVTLRGGEQTQFHVDLESVVEIATRVVVETEPREATVRLGGPTGRVLAKKTPAEVKLKPGKGMLHISAPGYRARKASYTLREGETLRLSYALEPESVVGPGEGHGGDMDGLERLGIGLTVTGGVLMLATGGLWLLTESRIDEANSYDRQDPGNTRADLDTLESNADTMRVATIVVGSAAAATLATGVVLWIAGGEAKEDVPAAGQVRLNPTLGGAVLEVTFE